MANRFINHLPHTEFGATLQLNEEQEKMCKVVYKLSEQYPDRYVFHGLWDPERNYPDEYVILPIQSTAFGKIHKTQGYVFANIIKSKDDPLIDGKAWIRLLSDNQIDCSSCMTDGNFYNPLDDQPFTQAQTGKDMTCTTSLKGGHVYPGKQNVEFSKEARATVELIPICSRHNSYALGRGKGNGTGFYMKLKQDMDILQLENYLNRNTIDVDDTE